MTTPTRPVLRYHGGKFRLAPWIISWFPAHRTYVEPFGGAAGVLLRKTRAALEVYNDLDRRIVNLFRVLRDPAMSDELLRQVDLTPYARAEFLDAYERDRRSGRAVPPDHPDQQRDAGRVVRHLAAGAVESRLGQRWCARVRVRRLSEAAEGRMTAPTLPRTPVPAHRWAWARERWSKGDLIATIANRLGVTPQAVQLHATRHGWPKRYKADRGQVTPRRWRCAEHGRLCTPEARCGCRQAWEDS